MKKNEIKNDPIRDFLISVISNVKNNSIKYLGMGLFLVAGVLALITVTSKSNPSNKILCIDAAIKEIDLLDSYCQLQDKYSSEVDELVFSVYRILNAQELDKDLSLSYKIAEMEKIDISTVDSPFIVSLFYKEHGEMLLDNENLDAAIEKFIKSDDHYSDKGLYSAKLNYRLASVYFEKKDYDNANTYIEDALDCDFENNDLNREIKYLKGKLMYN